MLNKLDNHCRRSIRLPYFDYSQPGCYFITLCVQDRRRILGQAEKNEMVLSELGFIVRNEWLNTEKVRPNVKIDKFIIFKET